MPANQSVRYGRNKASQDHGVVVVGIAGVARLLDPSATNFAGCQPEGSDLRLLDRGADPAALASSRTLIASVAESGNYLAAAPVIGEIEIRFPAWNVQLVDPGPLSPGTTVTITATESSGDALDELLHRRFQRV